MGRKDVRNARGGMVHRDDDDQRLIRDCTHSTVTMDASTDCAFSLTPFLSSFCSPSLLSSHLFSKLTLPVSLLHCSFFLHSIVGAFVSVPSANAMGIAIPRTPTPFVGGRPRVR